MCILKRRLVSIVCKIGSVLTGMKDAESCGGARPPGSKRRPVLRSGWTTLKLVALLSLSLLRKFWHIITSAVLILLLLYWLYGSLVAFVLLCVAILSKLPFEFWYKIPKIMEV